MGRGSESLAEQKRSSAPRTAGGGCPHINLSIFFHTNQNGLDPQLRKRGRLYLRNPIALLHDLDEDDEEREQDQRLDEGQSHEQGDLNSGTGRGITSQSFARS